jgi:hypothetical protein
MKNVVIFYDHLEYFLVIWNTLWPFGIVCGHLVHFSRFWSVWTKKNLATLLLAKKTCHTTFKQRLKLQNIVHS